MSHPIDVHPEDLLDKKRMGLLTGDEQRRLEEHAKHCEVCALENLVSADFAREKATHACTTQTVSRIAEGVLAEVSGPVAELRWAADGRRRRLRAWGAGLAIGFAATGAIAGFWSAARLVAPARRDVAAAVADPDPAVAARRKAGSPMQADPIVLDESDLVAAGEKEGASSGPSRARGGQAPVTVAELFARANDARRQGELSEAVGLYRQLQQRFPGSREEVMSRVALARLMLDRLDDPQGALVLFDRYLGASSNGTLAEEARLGKALALMRLGRHAEERQAWQKLLSAHPSSVYAERAQRRLAELR
jgi:tetratricopeptide (TPR) repeat protein